MQSGVRRKRAPNLYCRDEHCQSQHLSDQIRSWVSRLIRTKLKLLLHRSISCVLFISPLRAIYDKLAV
jgi:hypothetical protein